MAKLSSTVVYGDLKVAHDIRTSQMLYVNYDKPVWHSGNMGAGSGLDADLLDGQQGSSYMRTNADSTTTGIVTITKAASGNALKVATAGEFDIDILLGTIDETSSYKIRYLGSGTGVNNKFQLIGTGTTTGTGDDVLIMDATNNGTVNFPVGLQLGGVSVSTTAHNHNAAYLGITAKAADSDKLDALDSTAFLRSDIDTVGAGSIKSTKALIVSSWSLEQDVTDNSLNFIFNT